MEVRPATLDDVDSICTVLRRSIEVLCTADHKNDRGILDGWLRNMTPQDVRSWIENPKQRVLVAVENSHIYGVGAASSEGEITLNYVSPDARFRGVSKALLQGLERYLFDCGNTISSLISSQTAHRASKVSTLVRTFGHAHTEMWTATEWDRFKEIVRTL
jgi:ribosomal protein S18 acetylase RimI-like enzyme